jgi:hypothetical protein
MHDRLEAESVARALVSGHLAPQVTMIDQTDSLDERALALPSQRRRPKSMVSWVFKGQQPRVSYMKEY